MNYQDPTPSDYIQQGRDQERARIINLLTNLRDVMQAANADASRLMLNNLINVIQGLSK